MTDTDIQSELKTSGKLPKHIAIIMDGNGRWAQNRDLRRSDGHRSARETVRAPSRHLNIVHIWHRQLATPVV